MYLRPMSEHIISETEVGERFPELVDRALAGEDVRITRGGAVVAELKSATPTSAAHPTPAAQLPGKLLTQADLDWLRANRVGDKSRLREDAGEAVRRMRNEDWR